MKNILKLEEIAMFGLSVYALSLFHVDWWWYLVLIFGPDISMLGYLLGNIIGAACYNVLHHKGIAASLFLIGLLMKDQWVQVIGIVLFGHSSMDRSFGYGLKTEEGFKYTHLGMIGKEIRNKK